MENKVPPDDPMLWICREADMRNQCPAMPPAPGSTLASTTTAICPRRHGAGIRALRFNSAVEVAAPALAARDRGVPMKVLDAERPAAANFYSGLVLSPPDQHGAGDKLPVDRLALIDQIHGASN